MLVGGVHRERFIMHAAPDRSLNMLTNESGGVRALDFSADGMLLVTGVDGFHHSSVIAVTHGALSLVIPVHDFNSLGSLRGEVVVWDVKHRQLMKNWMAHKRSAVTCVKFSNDTKQVYSCGEDTKV